MFQLVKSIEGSHILQSVRESLRTLSRIARSICQNYGGPILTVAPSTDKERKSVTLDKIRKAFPTPRHDAVKI